MRVISGGAGNSTDLPSNGISFGMTLLESDVPGPVDIARRTPSGVVASLNLSPVPGDVEANLSLAEGAIRSAKLQNPELGWVVLPELFTCAYTDLGGAHEYAEDASAGMSVWRFSSLAHELDLHIAYGFPERLPDGSVANSANLVGPDAPGPLLTYRKINLVETTPEHLTFTPGFDVPVVESGGLRVAIVVCWDLGHPETVREAVAKGANLILSPAAWREPWGLQYELSSAARALDNGVYLATANQLGPYPEADFATPGGVFAPNGVRLSDGDTLGFGRVDPDFADAWRISYGDARVAIVAYEGEECG
ncbi:carbon-nitrogen hydrolase family protein [Rubrobacter indicoceani]|uniref:carbon-nitrogen hydrolase family protein n=1 Tax=Rubrobacter indicoceani TaxID=2051957 RepID=UPI000E5A44A0|nr:carbon-nitrogen hydrolase family protein [Rubrobacter indicoceani]